MQNKCSNSSDFTVYSSPELNLLIGLAFAAILAEDSEVDPSWYALNFFVVYRNSLSDTNNLNCLKNVIGRLLENAFSAFKKLGYPYYFDDYIETYHRILNSKDLIPPEIKKEMARVLNLYFKTNRV